MLLTYSSPGDATSGLGSVIGGAIGALGAAAAVYILLARQRLEDAERATSALLTEVLEMCRFIIGQLEMCGQIKSGTVLLPKDQLPRVLHIPEPIIYPAVADKVSLLPSPTNVVSFFARISEAQGISRMLAVSPSTTGYVERDAVEGLADVLINVCQLGKNILGRSVRDDEFETALSQGNRGTITKHTDEELERAQKNLPECHLIRAT